jgi:hypothetical protein
MVVQDDWTSEQASRSHRSPQARFASTVIQKTLYRAAIKNQTNTTPELSAITHTETI